MGFFWEILLKCCNTKISMLDSNYTNGIGGYFKRGINSNQIYCTKCKLHEVRKGAIMQFQTNLIYFKTESYKTKNGDFGYRHTLLDGDGNKYTLFTDVDSWQKRHRDLQQYDLIPIDLIIYKKDSTYQLLIKECIQDEY